MYSGVLQTDIVVWFGISEPQWDEEWEEEEFSLRPIKARKRNLTISKSSKTFGDFRRGS